MPTSAPRILRSGSNAGSTVISLRDAIGPVFGKTPNTAIDDIRLGHRLHADLPHESTVA